VEPASEFFAGLIQLLMAVVYVALTPVGSLFFGLIALLVLAMVYLAKRPDG
jgi:hypothetical protein